MKKSSTKNRLLATAKLVLATCLFALSGIQLKAQHCNNDTIPPIPECINGLIAELGTDGPDSTYIWGADLDAGSSDNCTAVPDLEFRLENGSIPSINPPSTPNQLYTSTGLYPVVMWVGDTSGNWSNCLTTVEIIPENCLSDTQEPVAICDEMTFISLDENGVATVAASVFDEGSFDLCGIDTILVRRGVDGPCDADTLLDDFAGSVSFCCEDVGVSGMFVVVRPYDYAGNYNECWTEVTIDDKLAPVCIAPADVIISQDSFLALNPDPTNYAQMNSLFGIPQGIDNCGVDTILYSFQELNSGCGAPSVIFRNFAGLDPSGNLGNECTQEIHIRPEFELNIPVNFYPGDMDLDSLRYSVGNGVQIGGNTSDQIFNFDCDSLPDLIIRSWFALNWCEFENGMEPVLIPQLDLNNDGVVGDAFELVFTIDSMYASVNDTIVQNLGPRAAYIQYNQTIRYNYNDTLDLEVTGTVFIDEVNNCNFDSLELPLEGWEVKITGLVTGETYEVLTDSNGVYQADICVGDTLVEVSLDLPYNYGQACPTVYNVNLSYGQPTIQDIPVVLEGDCPLLHVDLSTLGLRRCFPNNYNVQVCNLSDELIAGVYVDVALDSFMIFDSAELPGDEVQPNVFRFQLGDMEAGDCTDFNVNFTVSCDAQLGYTHCVEAHVYPDTVCAPPAQWSGANVEVRGYCDGDSVRIQIENKGLGNMAEMLDFIVVEDVIMHAPEGFQLNAGQTREVVLPANGATWRVQAEQEPFHPYGGMEVAAVEGCGGINQQGVINLFPLNNNNPFEVIDCRQNVGSFDPNDKQAFPTGYGNEHFIDDDVPLNYLIRFQNTGTDTAFRVVILDTLSAHLQVGSVRPGASSHDYDFDITDGNVLRFLFDDILLPDSNVNEPASHGYVHFRVLQQPDNAIGTRIENNAAIYFDFNDPIITNTVFHTIGEHFILVSDVEAHFADPLKVYPNPATDFVLFDLPEQVSDGRFMLTDAMGRNVRSQVFSGVQYRFERKQLPSGVYHFEMLLEGSKRYSGTIVLR